MDTKLLDIVMQDTSEAIVSRTAEQKNSTNGLSSLTYLCQFLLNSPQKNLQEIISSTHEELENELKKHLSTLKNKNILILSDIEESSLHLYLKKKHNKLKINNLSILNPQSISEQHSDLLKESDVILLNQSKNINTKSHKKFDVKSMIGTPEVLIQSKERVKKLAEVYTAKREVDAMLNLLPKETWDKIDSTFLEPSCGDGNFIEAIITKKLDLLPRPKQIVKNKLFLEYDILRAISSVYGIDICSENVDKCKIRVLSLVKSYCSNHFNTINLSTQFEKLLREIIEANYIVGDTLNQSQNIVIVEWEKPVKMSFRKRLFKLNDLSNPNNKPFKQEQLIKFNGK